MRVAVGQKTDKVHDGTFYEMFPDLPGKHLACADTLVDKLGALTVYLSAAHGVVAHFAVAHILVGGESHGGTVGL
jgi:hypothetical protein